MGTRTIDCRKFTPNIFNKSKCSHCFRQREEHSAAALESNRASRKVSKCGYLFVAPDWDFNNPLYRTKRWQRRWFVLYDDGELTYSVDEHPDTVPQASIDMTRVLEVTTAEEVTSHPNSVAITAPERVTFVKGTCPEESKWWLNILAAFPKSKGRHKRNATFPGGQTKSSVGNGNTTTLNSRNRHNSYHKDILLSPTTTCTTINQIENNSWENHKDGDNSLVTGTTTEGQDENNKNLGNEINNRVYTDQPVSSKSPPTRDKIHPETKAYVRIRNRNKTTQDEAEPGTTGLLIEDVRRDEKLKDIANTLTNLSQTHNRTWSATHNISVQNQNQLKSKTLSNALKNENDLIDEKPTRDETDYPFKTQDFQAKIVSMRPKSLPLASSTAPSIVSAIVKKIPPTLVNITEKTATKSSLRLNQLKQNLQHYRNQVKQPKTQHERGDPDGGCNLDDLSTNYLSKNSEMRVNLPAEEVLNSKKGWLMKQESRTGEWSKHWFTLRGAALFFYRDPVAEERGVLDGVLDVNSLTGISEATTTRNFGFQLTTWDNRRIILACISSNSRNNWINVLRNAAGLQLPPVQQQILTPTTVVVQQTKTVADMETDVIIKPSSDNTIRTEIEKDFIKAQRNQETVLNSVTQIEPPATIRPAAVTPVTPVTPLTPKTIHFSSDEEYRTASEGGRRESIDWGSPLSPSPPIPLALFRAKERMRSRSTTTPSPRLHKRSRSSPPSSRRSTVDSIGSDELPLSHPVQEELVIDKELQHRLSTAENERDSLRKEAKERDARMSELLSTLEQTEHELSSRIKEVEQARDKLAKELIEANLNAEKIIHSLTVELEENQKKAADLEDRLSRGIEENESLYKKIRDLEGGCISSLSNLNKSKIKRVDSLSDLTNLNEIDPYGLDRDMLADEYHELKSRFEKAVNEIKAMKKELKESQNQYDNLEISYAALKQDLDRREMEDQAQLQMMAERIQDLTLKYSGSEKQVRTLKQKLAKSERRRSLSLKGKEQLSLSKELEIKVNELETKVEDIEKSSPEKSNNTPLVISPDSERSSSKKSSTHSRRRSLESSASTDSLQFMVRLNELEKRIDSASVSSTSIPEGVAVRHTSKISEHLIDRLRCLEGVLISSKDKVEQSLQQLQSLRSSRTRRSVSPITDRKDSFRFVERCLTEVIKLIRESCDTCIVSGNESLSNIPLLPESNPIKLALNQLENQLQCKLGDILKQRRVLRERNELTHRKEMELLAERIAFESVCFGRLRESVSRAENPQLFTENQTRSEIAETTQLMSILKAKLSGKCTFKPTSSIDTLASVLARRLVLSSCHKKDIITKVMPPVDAKILDGLLRQQTEINLIAKRYRINALETLANSLAAETLSYLSSNDAVQGIVQEAWRQAQETVNAELVQSEIVHIMTRNAERLEHSITPSFGYTLTTEERITFENFADAVHDTLRREMDNAIDQLTKCYENSLQNMKKGQWRMHLEQERKASEGRQLLAEFADIIAHKALIDARVAILKGEYQPNPTQIVSCLSVRELQRYENLFIELAEDLKISNAADILAEADFNFMYKNYVFKQNKEQINQISCALLELEESIVILHSTLNPNTTFSITTSDLETFKEICQKCCELRQRLNAMMDSVQKLSEPCSQCEKTKKKLKNLVKTHETELSNLNCDYDNKLSILRKQSDEHVETIKTLETEKRNLVKEINNKIDLIRTQERELDAITLKLKSRDEECHQKESDRIDLINRLENQDNKLRTLLNEREKLHVKCSQQDEEYASLLQERDYLQTELNKEREKTRKLEKRLEMLELEHSKQLECLQEAYRDQILSHCSDISTIPEEESFRQRYQSEIEQLRTLCEKGLVAMESSHRRIVTDIEERHKNEIERLSCDKEEALAEETQATLAALDAMRKAHQNEVQREIARFKADFTRQYQHGESPLSSVREKEEELEELREEIMSFSEKYSIKCVENAALEEKLKLANQKLKQFQQMQQLELRNKQFLAHLASDNLNDSKFVQGLSVKGEPRSADSEHGCDENNIYSPHCSTLLLPLSEKELDLKPPPPPTSSPPRSENESDLSYCSYSSHNSVSNQDNHFNQNDDNDYTSDSISLSENNSNSDGEQNCKKFKSNKKGIISIANYNNNQSKIINKTQSSTTKTDNKVQSNVLATSSMPQLQQQQQQQPQQHKKLNSTTSVINFKILSLSNKNKFKKFDQNLNSNTNIEQIDEQPVDLPKISFNQTISNSNISNSNNLNKHLLLNSTNKQSYVNNYSIININNNNNNNNNDNLTNEQSLKHKKYLIKKSASTSEIQKSQSKILTAVSLSNLNDILINSNNNNMKKFNNNNSKNMNKYNSNYHHSLESNGSGISSLADDINKRRELNIYESSVKNSADDEITNTNIKKINDKGLKCSTSPLNGRDLELHRPVNNKTNNKNSTSHLRRFELEI